MPSTVVLVLNQIAASLNVLRDRAAQTGAITAFVITIIGIATAPGRNPGIWPWLGLLLISVLCMLSIVTIAASHYPLISPANRQRRVTASITLGVIALVMNLLFGALSTIVLGLGLMILGRHAVRIRPGVFPWLLCAAMITFIPWWIWIALDAWNTGLLILFPLAMLAYLSGSHIREAYRVKKDDENHPLSKRGHRLGAWMGILLGGILVIIAGLIGNSVNAWIALGGVLMAVAVAMEAGIFRPEDNPGKYSAALCDGAFAIAAVCWLIGIT